MFVEVFQIDNWSLTIVLFGDYKHVGVKFLFVGKIFDKLPASAGESEFLSPILPYPLKRGGREALAGNRHEGYVITQSLHHCPLSKLPMHPGLQLSSSVSTD